MLKLLQNTHLTLSDTNFLPFGSFDCTNNTLLSETDARST